MRRWKLTLAGLGAGLLLPGEAWTQHPGFGAPVPRPLHERLARADAVAIARVETVGTGRIQITGATRVRGAVAESFALKRSPASPPPLAPGDHALLLLRGARSPYVLVDEPHELVRLAPEEAVATWSDAIRALGEAPQPHAVYARWIEAGPAGLQHEAAIGLAALDAPVESVARVAAKLVERALNAESAPLRLACARAAVRSAAGRRQLLDGLPSDDPEILLTALRVTRQSEADAVRSALLRSLRHERAEVRGIALRASAPYARDRALRAALVRIAAEDPEEALRALARRLMKGPRRPAPDRPAATTRP